MVATKPLIQWAFLLASAVAAPPENPQSEEPHTLTPRDTRYICPQNLIMWRGQAEAAYHSIGFNTLRSGYPHVFDNTKPGPKPGTKVQAYAFDNNELSAVCAGQTLWEYPVLASGTNYNPNIRVNQGADPGPMRVLYSQPSKDFCGIIGHEGSTDRNGVVNPNGGILSLCRPG